MDPSPSTSASSKDTRHRRRKPPRVLRLMRWAFSQLGRLSPSLFGLWAYRLWFSTQRFQPPKRELPWIAAAKQVRVELAGFSVMTYQWGDVSKPLVVLVHGWSGRGSQMGAFAASLVAAGFRVLSFDAPGHGQTSGNSTTIFEMRDVLNAIADKISPIHSLIAHSFGGMVTALALSEGLAVNKAVLISSPAQVEYLVNRFSDVMRFPHAVRNNLKARLNKRFGDHTLAKISTMATSRRLGHIPALIIHDQQDHDVPVEQARQIHQAWPSSQLITTNGLGHKRILYNEEVVETVSRFLSEK